MLKWSFILGCATFLAASLIAFNQPWIIMGFALIAAAIGGYLAVITDKSATSKRALLTGVFIALVIGVATETGRISSAWLYSTHAGRQFVETFGIAGRFDLDTSAFGWHVLSIMCCLGPVEMWLLTGSGAFGGILGWHVPPDELPLIRIRRAYSGDALRTSLNPMPMPRRSNSSDVLGPREETYLMPHNPIVARQNISRTNLSFKIAINQAGVLYQGQRFIRLLQSGEGPSVNERTRLGEITVYTIDTAPHTVAWRVSLPTQGDKDSFNTTVNLKYRVVDPKKMVEEQVTDAENLVTRSLEPVLRKISRQYNLNQHSQADTAFEDEVARFDLASQCGLKLVDPPDIVINLSEADHRRIKQLEDLERAMRVARPAEHIEDFPSSDPAYRFKVTVNLSYQVSKPDQIPSDSLDEAERLLWPKIRGALRKASRKYDLTDIGRADAELQDTLNDLVDDGLEEFGLKVLAASASIDLGEDTRKSYVELAQVKHTAALEAAKLQGLKSTQEFYTGLIRQGNWAVLAVAVSKGEITTDELYQRLSAQERERLEMQISLLKDLRADNAKDESQDWKVSQTLMNTIAGQLAGSPGPAGPALSAPDSKQHLPDKQEAETRKTEGADSKQ